MLRAAHFGQPEDEHRSLLLLDQRTNINRHDIRISNAMYVNKYASSSSVDLYPFGIAAKDGNGTRLFELAQLQCLISTDA